MLNLKIFKAVPLASRYLNTAVLSRRFAIYTNETLKKNMDEKLKEKYIKNNQEAKEQGQEEESLYDHMKEAYEEIFDSLDKEASILRSYQEQVMEDEYNVDEQQIISREKRFDEAFQKHFQGISNEEFIKRSKKLIESARNRQAWNPIYKPEISQEYLEYDKYEKNVAKVHQVVTSEKEANKEFSLGPNFVRYIKNLDGSMAEKQGAHDIENDIEEAVKEAGGDEKEVKEAIDNYWEWESSDKRGEDTLENNNINFGNLRERPMDDDEPVYGRVSPWAKEEIYRLHREGWTIRDLSLRFGLLPERVKIIIWNRQYFYDEVLPNISLTTLELALEREMLYSLNFPWVDYGMDLELMAEREQGIYFTRYRRGEIDANPPKAVTEKMDNLLKKQTKKKYDIVTEGFVGHGLKGYYIKSWIVNKGHGSERVNRKFKMAVEQVNNPHLMPAKVRSKLHKGPRLASKGYGIQ